LAQSDHAYDRVALAFEIRLIEIPHTASSMGIHIISGPSAFAGGAQGVFSFYKSRWLKIFETLINKHDYLHGRWGLKRFQVVIAGISLPVTSWSKRVEAGHTWTRRRWSQGSVAGIPMRSEQRRAWTAEDGFFFGGCLDII